MFLLNQPINELETARREDYRIDPAKFSGPEVLVNKDVGAVTELNPVNVLIFPGDDKGQ